MPGKCHLCNKDDAKACCGGCKSVFYCNRQCQIKHWNAHKLECKKLKSQLNGNNNDEKMKEETIQIAALDMDNFVFTLPAFDDQLIDINKTKHGYGMMAQCEMKRGHIICREKAMLVLPDFAKTKMTFYIKQQFLLLSKTQQNIYKSLCTNADSTVSDHDIKLLSIFVNNQIVIQQRKSSCIFPLISRVNHSCIGNAHWIWNENMNELRLITLNDVHTNEEIVVNYCLDPMVLNERRDKLKRGWNLVCECDWCCNERISGKMEDVLKEYRVLDKSLDSLISKPLEGYRTAQKLMKIVEKHLNGNAELMHKHCYDAAQFALGLQKWNEASYYLETSMKEKQIAQGHDIVATDSFMEKVNLLPSKFHRKFRKFDAKYIKKMEISKGDDDQKSRDSARKGKGTSNGKSVSDEKVSKTKKQKDRKEKVKSTNHRNKTKNNKNKKNKKKKKKTKK